MVGFSQGLVGFLWKSDGAYNIFANDRESIENLAKYAYSLLVFSSLENIIILYYYRILFYRAEYNVYYAT